MLSPYVDYTIGSPQYTWLLNDLQAIDRTVTPFVRALNPAPHVLAHCLLFPMHSKHVHPERVDIRKVSERTLVHFALQILVCTLYNTCHEGPEQSRMAGDM